VRWLHCDGFDLSEAQWHDPQARCVGMFIDGRALPDTDRRGQRLTDDHFLLLFNAHHEDLGFLLPDLGAGLSWRVCIDTFSVGAGLCPALSGGSRYPLRARSVAVLSCPNAPLPWHALDAASTAATADSLEVA
jgi:glycogen operon protein